MTEPEGEREASAAKDVRRLIHELAKASVPIWHWGDGYGGSIKGWLRADIEALGLKWESGRSEQRREPIPRYLREKVIARDGLTCAYCSRSLEPSEVTIDHRVSVFNDGATQLDNLTIACRPCNSFKGAQNR